MAKNGKVDGGGGGNGDDRLHPRHQWLLQDPRVSVDRPFRNGSHLGEGLRFYLRDELVTEAGHLDFVLNELARRDVGFESLPDDETGVRIISLAAGSDSLSLARVIKERRPATPIGPHHILTPAQSPTIGPADDPAPAPGGPLRRHRGTLNAKFGAAVVDTGGWTDRHPVLRFVATTQRHVDPIDRDASGEVDWYGAGHGHFIAGVLAAGAFGVKITQRSVFEGLPKRSPVRASLLTEHAFVTQVDAAIARGAQLVNMSWGSYRDDSSDLVVLDAAIKRWTDCSTALLVCAAGNDGIRDPWYPAAYSADRPYAERVVSVGALEAIDRRRSQWRPAHFSNRGYWVNAWAPGTFNSLYPKNYVFPAIFGSANVDRAFPKGYAKWSGTSFATPYAAGEIARLAVTDGLSPVDAWAQLRAGAPFVALT